MENNKIGHAYQISYRKLKSAIVFIPFFYDTWWNLKNKLDHGCIISLLIVLFLENYDGPIILYTYTYMLTSRTWLFLQLVQLTYDNVIDIILNFKKDREQSILNLNYLEIIMG